MLPWHKRVRWLIKRASVVSAPELGYRLLQAFALQRLRAEWLIGKRPAKHEDASTFSFCGGGAARLGDLDWEWPLSKAVLQDALDGRWKALGFDWRWRDDPSVWHQAPETGRRWPSIFFGSIPYRADNPYGDARVIWEIGRLQQLVTLGLIANRGSEPEQRAAAALLETQLLSWWDSNPPLSGIHYVSAMECGLRLVAVCHAIDVARAQISSSSRIWRILPRLISSHAKLIERRLSLHSSLGNHTVAECTGLIYAGTLFPEFRRATAWYRRGIKWLEREADRQVLPDGGGIEQAFWYHLFVLDLCGLAAALLRHKGLPVPEKLDSAVARGRRFLATFAAAAAQLPDIGDRDGGYALSPLLRISWSAQVNPRRSVVFPKSGYTKLVLAGEKDSYLLLDHGRLGMAPGYGHGHADALSLLFYRDGRPVFIDPGTFGYSLDPKWRAYFRGTSAHNTIMIDGADQAKQETAFQWSAAFKAELVEIEHLENDSLIAIARHDGYSKLGATHWRAVLLERQGFTVFDRVIGTGRHQVESRWHCAVIARRSREDRRFFLDSLHSATTFELGGGNVELLQSCIEPPAGWRSDNYGSRQPCLTFRQTADAVLPVQFRARVRFDGNFGPLPSESRAALFTHKWLKTVRLAGDAPKPDFEFAD